MHAQKRMLYYIPPDVLISFVLVSASNALSIVFPVAVVGCTVCTYYAKITLAK